MDRAAQAFDNPDYVEVVIHTPGTGSAWHPGTLPMAEMRVFDHAPGVVARCPACDQVLLRMVRGPGRTWLDLRGLTYLQLPVPEGT